MTRRERRREVVRVGFDEDGWALYAKGSEYVVEIDDDGTETVVDGGLSDVDG